MTHDAHHIHLLLHGASLVARAAEMEAAAAAAAAATGGGTCQLCQAAGGVAALLRARIAGARGVDAAVQLTHTTALAWRRPPALVPPQPNAKRGIPLVPAGERRRLCEMAQRAALNAGVVKKELRQEELL